MSGVKTQIENRKRDAFFLVSKKNFIDAKHQIVIKDFSTVYDRLLQNLAKWFSKNNIF